MNLSQGTLTLKEITTLARETKHFRFEVTQLQTLAGQECNTGDFSFTAGQFVSLQFTEKAWRAYSVASHPRECPGVDLLIRIVEGGVASTILDRAQVGDTFPFKGPFGHFVLSKTPDVPLVFIATGTGIAPMRAIILSEAEKPSPRPMILLYGGRDRDDIAYLDEVASWAKNLRVLCGFSREDDPARLGPWGKKARVTAFLEEEYFGDTAEYYICGNGAMVESVREILTKKSVPKERIFYERFN